VSFGTHPCNRKAALVLLLSCEPAAQRDHRPDDDAESAERSELRDDDSISCSGSVARSRWSGPLDESRMKYAVVILILALAGCGRRAAVLAQPVRVMKQVQEWVPSGTPVAEAEKILASHQFSPTLVRNSSFADNTNATLLVCHPAVAATQAIPEAPPRWSVVLVITNGNVSTVHLIKAVKDS
jgi:hypothetical protein